MTVTILGVLHDALPIGEANVVVTVRDVISRYPYPIPYGAASTYENKVWDAQENGGAGGWHSWWTYFQDIDGTYYDGPGAWGVDTSDYKVQAIRFEQKV